MEILWRILATLVIWLTSWRQCMVFVNGRVNAEATNDKQEGVIFSFAAYLAFN